ncbi:MAG: hypothetical protein NVS2B12_33950 [Ktedonobacteraceae bacterium]
MEARIIKNRQQWDAFVEGAELCNVTQSYEWGQLLTMLDGEVLYVGVVDEKGELCAAMMLLVLRVAVANAVYFYAPRGPIIDDPDSAVMTVLLNYVKALAHKYHAFMLKVEPGVLDNDGKWLSALHRRGFVTNSEALHLRREWVLDVRPDEQTLLANMKEKWRYHVRLAGRKGVTVRRSENPADIDTFYRILQTTSQRDIFIIYDKSFYEKLVELYGQSQNVALFIAEYEGQPLGGVLLVKMGRWCWYMYGASSNEQRNRMPNHLLQWTAIRWAKEQSCWYYNFRGIPDILEESQPMWGIYVFKRGFGGYDMHALETHDLAYNPILYRLYRSWLDGRSWLKDARAKRNARQLKASKPEQDSDNGQTAGEQQKVQVQAEKPARENRVQAKAVAKQPEPVKPSEHEKKLPAPPEPSKLPVEQKSPIQQEQAEPPQTEQCASTYVDTVLMEQVDEPVRVAVPHVEQPAVEQPIVEQGMRGRQPEQMQEWSGYVAPTHARAEEAAEHSEAQAAGPIPEIESGKQSGTYIQTAEELAEQAELNEDTQKLPRIQMAQKHAGGRRAIDQHGA